MSQVAGRLAGVVMDVPKVRAELDRFVHMTTIVQRHYADGFGGFEEHYSPRAFHDDIVPVAHVVERILERLLPTWRLVVPEDVSGEWQQHRQAAQRALVELDRRAEVDAMLGDTAPTLSAGGFHPWVWEGARSMWAMAAYDRAVEDALARVNYETQGKSGLNRLGETKLFQVLFSTEDPKPDTPRLRLLPPEGVGETPETFRNRHLAVHALAQGLFAGLRNPAAHGVRTSEGEQQVALERLAAVSVLARWVEASSLVTAP